MIYFLCLFDFLPHPSLLHPHWCSLSVRYTLRPGSLCTSCPFCLECPCTFLPDSNSLTPTPPFPTLENYLPSFLCSVWVKSQCSGLPPCPGLTLITAPSCYAGICSFPSLPPRPHQAVSSLRASIQHLAVNPELAHFCTEPASTQQPCSRCQETDCYLFSLSTAPVHSVTHPNSKFWAL